MNKLKQFGAILKKVDKTKVSPEFWEKEKEMFKEMDEDNEKKRKSMKMSHEQIHKEFDL